jgi:hypothetical protein
MSTATNRLAGKAKNIALKDVQEAEILIKDAVKSQAYLYPIKGIYYFLTHSQLSKPLRDELGPTISTAVSVAGTMFFFTYLPQVAVLTLFNGPLAVVSTIFLVLSESATITNLISRSFFIEDALVDTFDGVSSLVGIYDIKTNGSQTLLIRDQGELVAQGRIIKPRGSAADTMSRLGKILKRPFARFTPTSLIRYFMYLPLNLIPIIGPILFITFQARKSGPQAHARYFQLKGMNKRQREEWVQPRTAEYIG